MSGRDAFPQYPEARFAATNRKRGAFAQYDPPPPRQNHILAALPWDEYERLLPDLEPIPLPPGHAVCRAGEQARHLYFPTDGIVSRLYVMENGDSARTAVTGREGVVGIALVLGGERMPGQDVVLCAGYAYRLRTEVLKSELARNGPLQQMLLRYTLALIAQTAQIAACNRHHTVEQQLCRWLLLSLDRLPGDEVPMTHDVIASMLGVRRESVTDAAGKLHQAGLIDYRRGHIIVRDRFQLEAHACECYAVVKREYDGLLSPVTTGQAPNSKLN